jgi:ubiquinone/menaquinone biosynthesis C-methylase UbiE
VAPDDFVTESLFDRDDIDYVSTDLHRENAQFNMDLTDLGFGDNEFDIVICYHTLEHIKDDGKAMREMHRVMKPGAWAILQVPLWADDTVEDLDAPREDYLRLYGHSDHVRRYGKDFKDRLEAAGFKVTLDDYVRHLPDEQIRKYGLLPNEDIYLCEKV